MFKTHSIRVRLTEEEKTQAENASQCLLGKPNKSKLLRKLLRDYLGMGPDLTQSELEAFRETVRQLTGIARNLNQITTRINKDETKITHLSETLIEQLNQQVTKTNNALKHYIKQTVERYQDRVNNAQ